MLFDEEVFDDAIFEAEAAASPSVVGGGWLFMQPDYAAIERLAEEEWMIAQSFCAGSV